MLEIHQAYIVFFIKLLQVKSTDEKNQINATAVYD